MRSVRRASCVVHAMRPCRITNQYREPDKATSCSEVRTISREQPTYRSSYSLISLALALLASFSFSFAVCVFRTATCFPSFVSIQCVVVVLILLLLSPMRIFRSKTPLVSTLCAVRQCANASWFSRWSEANVGETQDGAVEPNSSVGTRWSMRRPNVPCLQH